MTCAVWRVKFQNAELLNTRAGSINITNIKRFPNVLQKLFKAINSTSQWSVQRENNGTPLRCDHCWFICVHNTSSYHCSIQIAAHFVSTNPSGVYMALRRFQLSKQGQCWMLTKSQARNPSPSSPPAPNLKANCGKKWGISNCMTSGASRVILQKRHCMFVSDLGRDQVPQPH